MKVILFGATGMVGQGVLRECLIDDQVESILSIGRNSSGQAHRKLHEIVRSDLFDYASIETELSGFDACFFCLGVSSAGMTEAAYRRITYDLTIAAAETLVRLNPHMTFVFVSGAGTDSSEYGRTMWARVKGATENALLRLPFQAYMLRPAGIEAMHGITSRTKRYRVFYVALGPLFVLLRGRLPKYLTTTEQIGRAMLKLATDGGPKSILESEDISLCNVTGGKGGVRAWRR